MLRIATRRPENNLYLSSKQENQESCLNRTEIRKWVFKANLKLVNKMNKMVKISPMMSVTTINTNGLSHIVKQRWSDWDIRTSSYVFVYKRQRFAWYSLTWKDGWILFLGENKEGRLRWQWVLEPRGNKEMGPQQPSWHVCEKKSWVSKGRRGKQANTQKEGRPLCQPGKSLKDPETYSGPVLGSCQTSPHPRKKYPLT